MQKPFLSFFLCSLTLPLLLPGARAENHSNSSFLSDISGLELPPSAPPGNSNGEKTPPPGTVSTSDSTLRRENQRLKKALAAHTESHSKTDALALKKQITALTAENTKLKQSDISRQNDIKNLRHQVATLQDQIKADQGFGKDGAADLRKQLADITLINTQLSRTNKELQANKEQIQGQLAGLQQQLADVRSREAAARQQQTGLTTANTQLSSANNVLKTENEQSRQQIAELQRQLHEGHSPRSYRQIWNHLNHFYTMVNHAAGKPEDKMPAPQPALDTRTRRESYVAGVVVSRELQARLRRNQSLGLQVDGDILLSGVIDAYHNRSRLDEKSIRTISQSMDASLATAMKKMTEKARATLAGSLKGKTVLGTSSGTTLILEKKGKKDYRKGDDVSFDSLESTLNGKTIVNLYNNHIKYVDKLPPALLKAIREGRKGGQVALYGLAGDVYTHSSGLPDGVSANTPVKIEFVLH